MKETQGFEPELTVSRFARGLDGFGEILDAKADISQESGYFLPVES